MPCQSSVLSLIKHHRILHLFKNQYLWKIVLAYREDRKLDNIQPSLLPTAKPRPKPTPNCQLWWSKFNNITSIFWSMRLKPCYNFLSLSALSNIPYYHKKVEDEGSKKNKNVFILFCLVCF